MPGPPPQTGRADFPHPASLADSPFGYRGVARTGAGSDRYVSHRAEGHSRTSAPASPPGKASVSPCRWVCTVGAISRKRLCTFLTPRTASEGPSLHGSYPASPLLRPPPTSGRAAQAGYGFPTAPFGQYPSTPDLPGSSTPLSVRAVPYHPGELDGCTCL